MFGTYSYKYMKPKEYEFASAKTKELYDVVNAYKMAKVLSGDNGKTIQIEIVTQSTVGDVESVIGKNYKINVFGDKFDIIFQKNVNGYNHKENIINKLNEMELFFDDRSRSLGNHMFDLKFVIHFKGDPNLDIIMELLKMFEIE